MDLLVWLVTYIVQIDTVADGLANCIWMLYFNVTVMPEENFLVWLIFTLHVNSVMPEEKHLVWLLTFSNACKFSDARWKIPGVIMNF